jgi:hypothetical protein
MSHQWYHAGRRTRPRGTERQSMELNAIGAVVMLNAETIRLDGVIRMAPR